MKTSDLSGAALNWAVAVCEGALPTICIPNPPQHMIRWPTIDKSFNPSEDWNQGGPIIAQELLSTYFDGAEGGFWWASDPKNGSDRMESGSALLIAAMRCYVATKFGGEIDVPEVLL